jgi:hypothetical protein
MKWLLFLLLFPIMCLAQSPGVPLDSLPSASALTGTELIFAYQAGSGGSGPTICARGWCPVSITPAEIAAYIATANTLIIPIQNGGTGATTAAAAIENLLPTYVAGDCLSNNGTALAWATCGGGGGGGSGTVTSITVVPPSGFLVTPTTITTNGTFTWSGTLNVSAGGTGSSTAAGAMSNLLPVYVSGDCLSNSGGVLLWQSCLTGSGAVSSVSAGSTGLLTVSPTTGSVVADVANMAGYTVIGNGSGSTAAPTALGMPGLANAFVAVNETVISATAGAGPLTAWNPAGWGTNVAYIHVTPASGGTTICSLLSNGSPMQTVFIDNTETPGTGADPIIIENECTSDSTAANRIHGAGSILISPGGSAILVDETTTLHRWVAH